jgi:hypothetical protein
MALELSTDLILGVGALVVAAAAIIMFMRATSGTKSQGKEPAPAEPLKVEVGPTRRVQVPTLPAVAKRPQVDEARSKIRTLTLQQEILSMVMKRLFEAEDNGEITKDERERLGKSYDTEMSGIAEELKKAELIVSLSELEEIRTSIIEQFQDTLTDTQTKIDLIMRELKIEQPAPEAPAAEEKPAPLRKPKRARPSPARAPGEEEAEEEEGEEPEREEEAPSRADEVEDRLERLKKNVLKELEELDKLELEGS